MFEIFGRDEKKLFLTEKTKIMILHACSKWHLIQRDRNSKSNLHTKMYVSCPFLRSYFYVFQKKINKNNLRQN